MAYEFNTLQEKLTEVSQWLMDEYRGIRTGRATPQILDGVMVEQYGAKTQIPHMASVSVEDALTLRIVPWDKNVIQSIEKALRDSSIDVSISVDSDGLHVKFPELSEERREQTVKLVRSKFEDARVSVRNEREAVWNDIQKQAKDGEVSEDEKFSLKDDLQKIIDKANKELEEVTNRKEEEVMS